MNSYFWWEVLGAPRAWSPAAGFFLESKAQHPSASTANQLVAKPTGQVSYKPSAERTQVLLTRERLLRHARESEDRVRISWSSVTIMISLHPLLETSGSLLPL